jgi:hypothetical protein
VCKEGRENLRIEGRGIKHVEFKKGRGGSFISVDAVDSYLASNIREKEKVTRLKTEIQYARDTSLSLNKSSPVFKIRTTKIGHLFVRY